jgi:hypothetical protein
VAASAQENSAGTEIKTGSYWKPTIATKLRLGFWAAVKPERLKDVELVYAYSLSDLCNSQIKIDEPAILVRKDPVELGFMVDNQSLAAQSFVCSSQKTGKDDNLGWVILPSRVSGQHGTELISLTPGEALKPDFSKFSVDPNKGVVAAYKGETSKDFSINDLMPKSPAQ